jgi:hypothetical protein
LFLSFPCLFNLHIQHQASLCVYILVSDDDVQWMEDFEAFQAAASSDQSYTSNLTLSLSLVLDEFYKNLRTVGVSAVSGAGMEAFFRAIEASAEEYMETYKYCLNLICSLCHFFFCYGYIHWEHSIATLMIKVNNQFLFIYLLLLFFIDLLLILVCVGLNLTRDGQRSNVWRKSVGRKTWLNLKRMWRNLGEGLLF